MVILFYIIIFYIWCLFTNLRYSDASTKQKKKKKTYSPQLGSMSALSLQLKGVKTIGVTTFL